METVKVEVRVWRREEYVANVVMPKALYDKYKDEGKFWGEVGDYCVCDPRRWIDSDDVDGDFDVIVNPSQDDANLVTLNAGDAEHLERHLS
jgi:hypothetical protein